MLSFTSVESDHHKNSREMENLGSLEHPEEEITVIFFKEQKNDEKSQYTLTVLSIVWLYFFTRKVKW